MKRSIKSCTRCGRTLITEVHLNGNLYQCHCSESNIPGWSVCKECMIDHCVNTNCFACEYYPEEGNYENCNFFKNKMANFINASQIDDLI